MDVHNTFWRCIFVVCRLSEEMTECFKWYEEHYPKWLHPGHNKTPQVIISVYLFSFPLSLPFSPSLLPLSLLLPSPLLFHIYMYSFSLTTEFSGSCSQFKVSFTYTTCTVRMCHIDIISYAAMHCLSQVTITWQTFMTCLCKYTVAQIWSLAYVVFLCAQTLQVIQEALYSKVRQFLPHIIQGMYMYVSVAFSQLTAFNAL